MTYDYDEVLRVCALAREQARGATDITIAVRSVLGSIEAEVPERAMAVAQQMDWAAIAADLARQVQRVFRTEPPEEEVNGIWFGMFESAPTLLKRRAELTLYVSGSPAFSIDDPNDQDWPSDNVWFPDARCLKSEFHKEISKVRSKDGESDEADAIINGVIAEPLTLLLVAHVVRSIPASELLGHAPYRGVATGHDSGGAHFVGVLRPTGIEIPAEAS